MGQAPVACLDSGGHRCTGVVQESQECIIAGATLEPSPSPSENGDMSSPRMVAVGLPASYVGDRAASGSGDANGSGTVDGPAEGAGDHPSLRRSRPSAGDNQFCGSSPQGGCAESVCASGKELIYAGSVPSGSSASQWEAERGGPSRWKALHDNQELDPAGASGDVDAPQICKPQCAALLVEGNPTTLEGDDRRDPNTSPVTCRLMNYVAGGSTAQTTAAEQDLSSPSSLQIGPGCVRLPVARQNLSVTHKHYRFVDCYELSSKLGEGSFGDVHMAVERDRWRSSRCGHLLTSTSLVSSMGSMGSTASSASTASAVTEPCGQGVQGLPGSGDAAGGPGSTRSLTSAERRRTVAVKVFTLPSVNIERLQRSTSRSPRLGDQSKRVSFDTERALLSRLEHPNIVKVYECFEEADALYVVLELCRGGELYSRMATRAREGRGGRLPEPIARTLFQQMLSACAYLHAQKIVHRDLKTENFLLLGEENCTGQNKLKLCDFGSAAQLTEKQPRNMERVGTLSYTAPEVYENRGANVAADLWSLGVVLYVMLTGLNPFRLPDSNSREITVRRIRNGQFDQTRSAWLDVSEAGKDLVKSFLLLDEGKRLTSSQALCHQWIVAKEVDIAGTPGASPPQDPYASMVGHGARLLQRLHQIAQLECGHRLLLAACARLISEADLVSEVPWLDIFSSWDSNRDGRLRQSDMMEGLQRCRDELQADNAGTGGLAALGAKYDEVIFQSLDLDQSGLIEWGEWFVVAIFDALMHQSADCVTDAWAIVFRLLDGQTADGVICSDDMMARMVGQATPPPTTAAFEVEELLQRWGTARAALDASTRVSSSRQLPSAETDASVVLTFRDFDRMASSLCEVGQGVALADAARPPHVRNA